LELFTESETRDELGIGAIRDAIADQLFPGTSVIQTRLRYMLLVPWLFIEIEEHREPAAKFSAVARRSELDLGQKLAAAAERGVFGRSAGEQLKRLPSSVYWAGLGTWGLRVFRGAQQEYFRQIDSIYSSRDRRRRKDDGDWLDPDRGMTWHPTLKLLKPVDFPEAADLQMRADESRFIREQWKKLHPKSLLAWLAFDEPSLSLQSRAVAPWLHPRVAVFPDAMRTLVEHGRHFSDLVAGAARLYNLHLSEVDRRSERVESYQEQVQEWSANYAASGLAKWDLAAFWGRVVDQRHSISFRTQRFVEEWLAIVREANGQIGNSASGRALIVRREQDMKQGRSRFTNAASRKQWSGASGLAPLTYRWGITSTFLDDLATGLASS
jgi:hypothetical protein